MALLPPHGMMLGKLGHSSTGRVWRGILRGLGSFAIVLTAGWGALALWYQFPGAPVAKWTAVAVWALLALVAIVTLVLGQRKLPLLYLAALAALLLWWVNITPRNDRLWADDVARATRAEVDPGNPDIVRLTQVRNFDWRSETDYTPRWEARTYDLSRLATVDLVLSYWSSPAIAHTLVSFGFEGGDHVTFSVEIRKQKGQEFSEIGGFFKEFALSLIAADERDIIRLRSNVRKEDVYLYRIGLTRPAMRSLFLSYVDQANSLAETPRWYNTVTANCTTIVYEMVKRIVPGLPLDYRLLFSGYLPEYVYDVGGLVPGHSLDELRRSGRIADRAIAADRDPHFSQAIRAGMVD
ncbi:MULTISPECIES: DUF4105 domain-containing protein [unclassified Beijerinckia]|uniref:Lnb N-terminal periplasmic domain-containing protein n=1 Tax=unclassified Beijerinckia TaxID=2638183 RepID=UPI00089C1690|nr:MULTISPECIES: DUF4105 domain-containing protein [unclassified Beijerinckia]MDH7797229.1 hypothetical protein [Beijerinckia sp. GAS462]SEC77165.1 protein of unknown function [Beijerinckia sp. 28-YEA-48]